MSFFFFYSYGAHRDLHSFPTRRSSDLVMMAHREVVQYASCLPGTMPIGPGDRVAQASNVSFDAAVFEIWGALDRKSTRLNSSHSQISYAVFCLKKKKKKHRNNEQIKYN